MSDQAGSGDPSIEPPAPSSADDPFLQQILTALDSNTREMRETKALLTRFQKSTEANTTALQRKTVWNRLSIIVLAVVVAAGFVAGGLFFRYVQHENQKDADAEIERCEQANESRAAIRSAVSRNGDSIERAVEPFATSDSGRAVLESIRRQNDLADDDLAKALPTRHCN